MLIVTALGGSALQRRGHPMTAQNQRDKVRSAAKFPGWLWTIDRGADGDPYENEPASDGTFVNLGHTGDTAEASKSPANYVTVTQPDGGEVWPAKQVFPVCWRTNDAGGRGALSFDGTDDYATLGIGLLAEEQRPFYQDHLAHILLKHQEKDGSWWDYPLYNYHQQYGTAFAIMSLNHCRH